MDGTTQLGGSLIGGNPGSSWKVKNNAVTPGTGATTLAATDAFNSILAGFTGVATTLAMRA
jgi:hypothetical protein